MTRLNQLLFKQFKQNLPFIILVIVLSLTYTVFSAILPIPYKFILDNVIGNELIDKDNLIGSLLYRFPDKLSLGMFISFVYLFIHLISHFLSYIQSLYIVKFINKMISQFSAAIFKELSKFNIGFFKDQDIGDYLYRINSDTAAINSLIDSGFLPIINSSLYLVITFFIMLSINTTMTIIVLISVPIICWSLYFINQNLVTATNISEKKYSHLYTYLYQFFSQLKIIQSYNRETIENENYQKHLNNALDKDFKVCKLDFFLSLVTGIIITLMYTSIIIIGLKLTLEGTITSGLFIIFIFYLDNLVDPLMTILYSISESKQAYTRLKRLSVFLNPHNHTFNSGQICKLSNCDITFQNIALVDPNTKKPRLKKITCYFKQNHFNAIIGESGSGKSTLINLISRLEDPPSSGQILIGNHPLNNYNLAFLRNNIAYVPQECDLYNDTIANIIKWGNPEATFDQIISAAKLACAHDFITKRQDGYQSKVGEKGETLSGGQRQRLAIARAFIKNAPIMILDEIFSSQDFNTYKKLLHNLRKYAHNKTIIMITHSLEDLEPQDNLVLIAQGQILFNDIFSHFDSRAFINQANNK